MGAITQELEKQTIRETKNKYYGHIINKEYKVVVHNLPINPQNKTESTKKNAQEGEV